tara:strand:+ start:10332 stop:10520 length:189 start_codon:yes stop_codon:yes gene_type:complete
MANRLYKIELEFDEDIPLAETERRVCASIEELINHYWGIAAEHNNCPVTPKSCIAVPGGRMP